MLRNEAHWIGHTLSGLESDKISPVLNVGSATAEFRERIQPWIDTEIFKPLRERGVKIEHSDIQQGDGIDLQGDLTDNSFVSALRSRDYKAVLCCNVLEHVSQPAEISAKIEGLIPFGGYILVTVPHRFPYHPDPIDTLYRPTPAQVAALFPRCRDLRSGVLDCGTGWDYVERNPLTMLSKLKRRLSGMAHHGGVKGSASFAPWLFRRFKQTCILLQKLS